MSHATQAQESCYSPLCRMAAGAPQFAHRSTVRFANRQALHADGMAACSGASEFQDSLQTYRICKDFADGSSRTELTAFLCRCVCTVSLLGLAPHPSNGLTALRKLNAPKGTAHTQRFPRLSAVDPQLCPGGASASTPARPDLEENALLVVQLRRAAVALAQTVLCRTPEPAT